MFILYFLCTSVKYPAIAQGETNNETRIFILDASGSMAKKDTSGRYKIDAAKEVVKVAIDNSNLLPVKMGLIQLGGKCE
jgi:Mg-chelatase subunit ChlD